METSLHRSLKERYAAGSVGRREVTVERFRIDAVDDSGRLIEIQSGALGPLRSKLRRLLADHRKPLGYYYVRVLQQSSWFSSGQCC